jgi:peptidoglycan/xylan/chitin deacetylase (PgdA/CDA1 family)/RimJ/RimL family protein N-acetyltransferase
VSIVARLPSPLVLAYHSVRPGWSHPLSVTPETFRGQLLHIAERGYSAVRFSEAASAPDALVAAVTFDDAFASVVPWAEEVLDELGWPATVFVPAAAVDAGAPLAWLAAENPGPEFASLTWTELERLAARGWEIGSHALTHRRLSTLDDAELERELAESRAAVERHVSSCTAISYPWGEVDDRVIAAARRAGYETGSGLVGRFTIGDPMRVPRFPVSAADGALRYRFKTSQLGWRARTTRAWPILEQVRADTLRAVADVKPAASGAALRRAGGGPLAVKTLQRLWSTRYALGIVCELNGARPRADSDAELRFAVEPAMAFNEVAALLERSRGFEYLFLRGIERTRRADAGALVVARRPGGEPAAFHFVHYERHRVPLERVARGLYPQLSPDEALTEAVYVLPEARGRHVASAMLDATLERLAQEGIARAYAYIDVSNRASLRAFHRVGFRPSDTMRIDRYRLGRLRTTFARARPDIVAAWTRATE